MSRRFLRWLLLLAATGAFCLSVGGSPAAAAGLSAPVADCDAHGRLTHHYTAAQLRAALATMPADIAQYTNCPNVINQALLSEIGGLSGGSSGGGGGSALPGWAIAVIVVVALAGAGFGAVAVRNRRSGGGGP